MSPSSIFREEAHLEIFCSFSVRLISPNKFCFSILLLLNENVRFLEDFCRLLSSY